MRIKAFISFAKEALKEVAEEGEANAIALLLVEEVLLVKREHIGLIDTEISLAAEIKLTACLERLKKGEPLQYVLGYSWFKDLVIQVSPAVLIPRPETEELVDLMLAHYPKDTAIKVVDIGTGSGCIAIALAKARPNWEVHAVDTSKEALTIAQINAKQCGVNIHFHLMDILQQEAQAFFTQIGAHVIVSNPPYIPLSEKKAMENTVLLYEPHLALFVRDEDPLLFYKKIVQFKAADFWFEIAASKADEMKQLHPQLRVEKDMSGNFRFARLSVD